MAVLNNKCT